jgi:chemotaxis protein CheD
MDERVTVGIADMRMLQREGILITYALGSCIGLCFYDSKTKLGALLHILLPLNMEAGRKNPLKYADSGIRETLRQMETMGAARSRITVKIAGGARMFEISGSNSLGNIGQRNVESVHTILRQEHLSLQAEDVGGTSARTLLFDVSSGQGCIRSYGKKDILF